MEGLPINATDTLREFQRWLSRSGYKYPMVGCKVNASDIQAAVKFAISATGCVIERKHLASLVELARIGAANVLHTKSAPSVTPTNPQIHAGMAGMKARKIGAANANEKQRRPLFRGLRFAILLYQYNQLSSVLSRRWAISSHSSMRMISMLP